MSLMAATVLEREVNFSNPEGMNSTGCKVVIDSYDAWEVWNAPAWFGERMAQDFPQLKIVYLPEGNGLSDEIGDTDVLIAWSLTPEQFAGARRLKWIHAPAAGINQLMRPDVINSQVVITNARDVQAPLVAEHALACMFALAKRIPQCLRYQSARQWGQLKLWEERPRPREIAGATVLVLGIGSIGYEFTVRAKALGMRVLAVRQNPRAGANGADAVYGPAHLNEILPEVDFVVLCAPCTPSSMGLMNSARLSKMKPTAYLINVGRGELVDEPALLEALHKGWIAGAALDVFQQEPLPPESPFWALENLLITPHFAAATESIWERHYQLICDNMARFLDGRPLLNQVDKQRGY